MPRYPRELLVALKFARKVGLEVLLVTDNRFSSIADEADQVLVTELSRSFTFDSYAAPTVLTMLLLEQITDLLPETEAAGLDRFDELAQEQQFFVP
ncbi:MULTISPECIES: hypothetical protein [unclassified Arthrobacter]|uniref:hypothetical protein n=1 Tax=unclassified Arthrobacter TaxID=235627 RepID=UPI0028834CF9|nr:MULTISPECIES: hypothetical protein [unclassified Arthrobacter]